MTMTRLIIHIHDPKQEKVVEDLLEKVKGIEVERDPARPKKAVRKTAAKQRTVPTTKSKSPTAAEKRFMKDLTEAFDAVKDHLSGKKKLPLAKDLLNEQEHPVHAGLQQGVEASREEVPIGARGLCSTAQRAR
jgi:hypothetical protein